MKSMKCHYWLSQCEKGFKLKDDEDSYSDLADKTLYIDNYIWVYTVNDIIYAAKYKDVFNADEIDYEKYILN